VAKIMAACVVPAPVKNVTCYDPAAGSGTLLMNLAHAIGEDRCTLYTQDVSQKSSSLLQLNPDHQLRPEAQKALPSLCGAPLKIWRSTSPPFSNREKNWNNSPPRWPHTLRKWALVKQKGTLL